MQRWMNEQPRESPFHNIGFVVNSKDSGIQTTKPQSKQQTETSSNQATDGSLGDESRGKSVDGKQKKA